MKIVAGEHFLCDKVRVIDCETEQIINDVVWGDDESNLLCVMIPNKLNGAPISGYTERVIERKFKFVDIERLRIIN